MRAVIFDMDGLIVDTEVPEFLCWQRIYARHGVAITPEEWVHMVGMPAAMCHPAAELSRRCGRLLDESALKKEHRRAYLEMLEQSGFAPQPGFPELLAALAAAGTRRAVASTATRDWVAFVLGRMGIAGSFQAIVNGEDVARGKPHPDVYLRAAELLGVPPGECLALEDSAPGVQAARAAGMRCIAVPNGLTRYQDLSAADRVVPSLAEVMRELASPRRCSAA